MSVRCWDELAKYGVDNLLRREYGHRVKAAPEPDYNVSLEIDLEQFPPEGGEQPSHVREPRVAHFDKRNAMF